MPGHQSKAKQRETGKTELQEKAPSSGALDSGAPVGMPLFLQGRFAAVQAKRDSAAGDPSEQEAESVAQAIAGPNVKEPAGDSAGVRPLLPAVRERIEPVLGTDLSDVRVHSDAQARQTAAGIGAQAFTSGRDIWLGPNGHAGDVRLMAHEATHVRQQARDGAPRVQRQPDPASVNSCTAPTGVTYDFQGPFLPPFAPFFVQNEVKISSPNESVFKTETVVLDEPVLESIPIVLYAIPIELTDLDPMASPQVCRAPVSSPDKPAPPNFTPATTPAPNALSTPPSNLFRIPGFNAPKIVTAGGVTITPELITDAFVIVSEYHHFSVGAGATTLLKTPQGIRLIDAGVGNQGREALSQALVEKIGGIIGEEPIAEVMITHLHEDHTSLLPRLAEKFPIGKLRVNSLQFADPRFQKLLADIAASQAKGVQDRAAAEFDAKRVEWEKGEGSTIADKNLRERAFEIAKQGAIQEALADLVARPTQVELLVPGEGGKLIVENTPLGDLPSLARAPEDPITEGLHRAGVPGDISDTAVVDPSLGEKQAKQQDKWAKEGESDPTKRSKVDNEVIDTASTSWIIDLPGGNRLMVVPDLRTDDLRRKVKDPTDPTKEARGHFEQALQQLTKSGNKFIAWNMTHHMQSGWVAGENTHIGRVAELVKFTEFMNQVRQTQAAQRAPGQKAPADIVVVSAQHDLARSMIDPATVWLLRSLGFEVFLASSGRDVRLIEATTAGGQKIEGVAGLPYEGLRPSDPLLKESGEALQHLDQKYQLEEARKAPARMKTADKSALKADREANQARIDKARDAIRAAREAYIEAVNSEFGRGPDDVAKPSVAPDPAKPLPAAIQTAEQALRDSMRAPDLADFTSSATPETPIISDTALVLMRLHGDRPLDPLDKQIAESNERLDLLRGKLMDDPIRTKAELINELDQFRKLIKQKLPTSPEASKPALEEELANSQKELDSLTHPKEGQPLYSREPLTGRLIQSRVEAAPVETKASDSVRKAAGIAGRGLGALMVIQTISAEDELIQKVQSGKANTAEAVVGTVKNVQGIAIGVRMMSVIEVHPAEFVVMSVLDIAETALADYATPEQKAVAFAKSGLRAGISLGLMLVGQGMMESGNPYVVAAGFGIMFLTEPIMDLLDSAGLFDAIERWSAFLPSEVTGANQHLRDLMKEYHGILGAMQLAARSNEDLQTIGVGDPEGLRRAANLDMETYRERAVNKERELLTAFDEGYTQAQKEFAGLYELDTLRSQFLILRQQVHQGDELRDDSSRKSALGKFEAIDQTLSLDNMTDEQIEEMPQWEKLREATHDLAKMLGVSDEGLTEGVYPTVAMQSASNVDWEDVWKKQQEIDQMLRSAHYRLDPQAFGLRSQPLFSQGSNARGLYESKLDDAEWEMDILRKLMVQTFAPDSGIGTTEGEVTTGDVELALQQYTNLQDAAIDTAKDRPFTAADLNRRAMAAGPEYRKYVKSHDDYANALQQLRASEMLLNSMALRAARSTAAGPPAPNEVTLPARIQSAISRRELLGLLYLEELDERVSDIHEAEIRALAPILGEGKNVHPLSPDEKDVLQHHELKDYRYGTGTITNRLQDIPNLHLPEKPEDYVNGIGLLVDEDYNARREDEVLVGRMGDAGETTTLSGHHQNEYVVALTPHAISFIGTGRVRVWDQYVQSVTLKELQDMGLAQK
jgi:hypothetical protein